jgi:hypothetical protein
MEMEIELEVDQFCQCKIKLIKFFFLTLYVRKNN